MEQTRQITFQSLISSTSNGTTTTRLDQSIQWSKYNSTKKIKLVNCFISGNIPNVYNYGGVNNGLVRVTNDGGSSWTSIQLDDGIYTATDITNAINYSVSSWHTSLSDPALVISTNDVIGKCYITLDSTKLATGSQIGIDLTQSTIYDLLGFLVTDTFTTDGQHDATNLAKLDWFGNTLSIKLDGFGSLSVVNSSSSNIIATLNLSNKNGNLYQIDTSSFFPVTIFPPSQISSYKLSFLGSRNDSSGNPKDIIFLEGEIQLTFQIMEYV